MAEKKPMSEARKAANKRWNDANMKVLYDRIQLVVPKGTKAVIQAAAKASGESMNEYIQSAISLRLKLDEEEKTV
ncbi:MAG: hypothetical protein LUH45_05755 [Clostridiales bacterium]|nr:hypothetical protein [Clostridiales bacterium]